MWESMYIGYFLFICEKFIQFLDIMKDLFNYKVVCIRVSYNASIYLIIVPKIGLGIVGRENKYRGRGIQCILWWSMDKNYPFSIQIPVLCFGTLLDVFSLDMVYWIFTIEFQESYGSSFMGSNIKIIKNIQHRVLETSSLATL